MTTAIERLATSLAGRYTIEGELGHGGMATVYLAHDVRHDRKVALKVLRPELSAVIGAERFLAEIKTTASLQHPHILPLHDSGEAENTVFYVMPLVEGHSLRDRLNQEKQLPVDEAVRIAREVASALDYAHRHSIVHRDIKPENILLHDGQAVVADFGIALAVSRSEGGSRMTETGMSLGTPHYMAPEQAMGEREITPKADIYALGCVLYEMLTGDPPFTGSTAQAVVARTLTETPRSIALQRHTVPPHVEATAFKAIEKLPADRFATAGEFANALDNPVLTLQMTGAHAARMPTAHAWRARMAVPFAVVAVLALGAFAWSMLLRATPTIPVGHYSLAFPPDNTPMGDRAVAISRDGEHFAYIALAQPQVGNPATQVWIKSREFENGVAVPGTIGVLRAEFSPDGKSIAFVSPGYQLKKVTLLGGASTVVADSLSTVRGLAWFDDQTIIAVAVDAHALIRFAPDGSKPDTVFKDSSVVWNPSPLPGARGVLFSNCGYIGGCGSARDLWVLDLKTRKARSLIPGVLSAQYLPNGHIVYVRQDGAMLAVPFNLGSLELRGQPVPVRDSISLGTNQVPLFAISDEGTFLARIGANITASPTYEMVWVDRAGRETIVDSAWKFRVTNYAGNVGWSVSRDGTRLAIGLNTEAGDQIWLKQLPNGALNRVSFDSTRNHRPHWNADGTSLTFISVRGGLSAIYTRPADGTGSDKRLFSFSPNNTVESVWSPDSKWLVFRSGGTQSVAGNRKIWRVGLTAGADSAPKALLLAPGFDEAAIALSPDGRWIAYESNETGVTQVFIRPFPNTNDGKWQISTAGGRAPLWAKSGRELFFVDRARDMNVVSLAPATAPNQSVPRKLFHLSDGIYLEDPENYTPFDVMPDGQRFIMARRLRAAGGQAAQVAPLILVTNWFEELRQRLARR